MSTQPQKVWVVGHKNPDTDSICAAISYAYLKNQIKDKRYVAKRAGEINPETRYVLDYFGVEEPAYVSYAGAQIKDISYRKTAGVTSSISMKRAWELMKKLQVVTLPVTTRAGKLDGVIVTKDIATSYMDVLDNRALAKARTQYKTIAETLDGHVLVGNEHAYFINGKVVMGASDPGYMATIIEDDDLVILGDREEVQLQAVRCNASCIVIGGGLEVSSEVLDLARKQDCVIIVSPYDTFSVARLINQSMPIKQYMTRKNIITVQKDDYVNDVQEILSKERHRDFPILNENGNYMGMLSRRNLMRIQKKQLILVDHNEKSQTVDGIEEAEILEIIDHHRIGSLETMSPVFFRNQPLGCTSTIIYLMYHENGVEIPKEMAGLMLSAILSDTLMFRSPTCTLVDKQAAEELAKIAEVDIEEHARNMFRAGSDFQGKTAEQIFYQDFKVFHTEDTTFGVAQISAMSKEELDHVGEQLREIMPQVLTDKKLDTVYVMLTDILNESSKILYEGSGSGRVLAAAFHTKERKDGVELDGIVSRKKQFIPAMISAMADRS
jgi:manganese-dependent inorganic pyrophosphatase